VTGGNVQRQFRFTFDNIRACFREVQENGYTVVTCRQYLDLKRQGTGGRILVNRIDIDLSIKKALRLCGIFNDLGIRGSFFVRLHAAEYNPFSFEGYRILKTIRDSGHEIGYHSEVIDEASIWGESAEDCLKRDIDVLNRMLDIRIEGAASHGGMTGLNNLDFWKDRKPSDYGLRYEGYDKQPEFNLFDESLYVSDSNWTSWKCYSKGKLVDGDRRTLGDHSRDGHPLIYSLIHSDTYFDEHFYE
jgi:hypothetical protein